MILLKRLFGTDGIRGIVNEELTVELAMRVGNAVARLYNGKYDRLLIAMDTRNSGKMFEIAIASGAVAAGMKVESCGVIPTPSLAYLTKKEKTVGIMISASHNPSTYNGLKVLCEGFKIPDEEEVDLENIILSENMEYAPYGDVEEFIINGGKDKYIEYVKSIYKNLNLNYKIAIDVGNGAAGSVIESILNNLNLNYTVFNNEPDGFNINQNCGSTAPDFLSDKIKKGNYDFGILFDGDADRCLFLDSKGNLVDGDKLMAINAFKLKKQNRLSENTVVATIMSNLGFEEYLKEHGINLVRTGVGDKYVLQRMIDNNFTIGGEQSGHIIFMDRSTTGDGLITALETLDTMKFFEKTIDELICEIPSYPQLLKNVSVKNKKDVMKDERIEKLKEKYENISGLKLVLRPSGTEHKIRVMAEGKDAEKVNSIVYEFVELIELIDKEY